MRRILQICSYRAGGDGAPLDRRGPCASGPMTIPTRWAEARIALSCGS